MALYDIDKVISMGWSHSGGVTVDAENTVELTDEEVAALVALIKEKGTSDVEKLELHKVYPDIYEKLNDAYYEMAYNAERSYWLWEGYESGCYEYDGEGLMEYCKDNCGYEFEYDEDDYLDEDGDIDEDRLHDDEIEAFGEWLDDYLYGLPSEEAEEFLCEQMGAEVDVVDLTYSVEIPQAIIEMAKK